MRETRRKPASIISSLKLATRQTHWDCARLGGKGGAPPGGKGGKGIEGAGLSLADINTLCWARAACKSASGMTL